MAGIKSLVNMNLIRRSLDDFVEKQDDKALKVLIQEGETFVNNARDNGDYDDHTGNLRSSIGYIILKDGKEVMRDFQKANKGSDRDTGVDKGIAFAKEMAQKYPKGWVLIGVAGMNYAASVESRGRDVITASANKVDIKSYFV